MSCRTQTAIILVLITFNSGHDEGDALRQPQRRQRPWSPKCCCWVNGRQDVRLIGLERMGGYGLMTYRPADTGLLSN